MIKLYLTRKRNKKMPFIIISDEIFSLYNDTYILRPGSQGLIFSMQFKQIFNYIIIDRYYV